MSSQALHPLAIAANQAIQADCPALFGMLSQLGRRIYFPSKGILAQGAEAAAKGSYCNATVGIATEGGVPMHLEVVHRHVQAGLTPAEAYPYAPSQGKPDLRKAWAAKQVAETPSLAGQTISLPVVTNALTHGLSLVADLFLDPGETALISDLHWENYGLGWGVRLGVQLQHFALFDEDLRGLDLPGFRAALARQAGRKTVVVLNFPNNPSGYAPTRAEAVALVEALTAHAAAGNPTVVVCDDAYYGMFYAPDCATESLFGALARAHENLLAVKVDGATKEEFVWGFRVGFLTYGLKNGTAAVYGALEQKTAGLVRGTVSNISAPGQSIVLKALNDPAFRSQQAAKVAILKARYEAVRAVVARVEYADCWRPYPFNSGYFMCVRVLGVDAEALRQHLLANYGVGVIATSATDVRVAFSCLELDKIPGTFERLAQAIRELRRA